MNECEGQKDRQIAMKFVYSANYVYRLECYQLVPASMTWNVELTASL